MVTMMDVEVRKGKEVPVIKKALTELDGPLFAVYKKYRTVWDLEDCYQSPGPIQFYYPNLTPFLVRPPTDEQLNLHPDDVDYTQNLPYDVV